MAALSLAYAGTSLLTYRVGDEQFIAVVAGWGGVYPNVAGEASRKGSLAINRSRVLAFKLGGRPSCRSPSNRSFSFSPSLESATMPPRQRASTSFTTTARGAMAPLRSAATASPIYAGPPSRDGEAWKSVVLGGTLKDRGIVSFSSVLKAADAQALRAYVTQAP